MSNLIIEIKFSFWKYFLIQKIESLKQGITTFKSVKAPALYKDQTRSLITWFSCTCETNANTAYITVFTNCSLVAMWHLCWWLSTCKANAHNAVCLITHRPKNVWQQKHFIKWSQWYLLERISHIWLCMKCSIRVIVTRYIIRLSKNEPQKLVFLTYHAIPFCVMFIINLLQKECVFSFGNSNIISTLCVCVCSWSFNPLQHSNK